MKSNEEALLGQPEPLVELQPVHRWALHLQRQQHFKNTAFTGPLCFKKIQKILLPTHSANSPTSPTTRFRATAQGLHVGLEQQTSGVCPDDDVLVLPVGLPMLRLVPELGEVFQRVKAAQDLEMGVLKLPLAGLT